MAPVKKPPHTRERTFLRAWRLFHKLSMEAVAERVGVDHSTIQRTETGSSPYSQDLLEKLAFVYGCRPIDLISVDPKKEDILRPLVHQLREAPLDVQRQAAAVVDAIIKTRPQK